MLVICTNVIAESDRIRKAIQFETVQYGQTFTNETFDIYGIDLPKGIKLLLFIVHFHLFVYNHATFPWFSSVLLRSGNEQRGKNFVGIEWGGEIETLRKEFLCKSNALEHFKYDGICLLFNSNVYAMCVTSAFVSHEIINGMLYMAKDLVSNELFKCKPFHLRDWISVPNIFCSLQPRSNNNFTCIIIKLVVVCIHSPCDIFSSHCLCVCVSLATFLALTQFVAFFA